MSLRETMLLIPGYDPFATAGDCWWDENEAGLSISFFHECLRHIEGRLAGKPFLLEPWQQAIIGNLFGWKRPDGTRRYREAFILVPRKNGKSPLAAGVALNVLFRDQEIGQQNYLAAADREQAAIVFRYASGMVAQEPELSNRCRIYGGHAAAGQSRSIVVEEDGSFIRVLSADADTKHGGTTHLAIVDELHAQPNRDLIDVLKTSLASANRLQPLMVYITTADFDRVSICNEKHDHARQVRDRIIEDREFLPVLYELAPEDDWTSEDAWRKVNPNLGVSVSLDYLRRECEEAKRTPSYENTFKRLHLNIRTGQDVRWLSMESWDACGAAFEASRMEGREVVIGIDFGWRDDYAAMAVVWREGDVVFVLPHFWLPEEGSRDKHVEPTRTFIDAGLVQITHGSSTDIGAIYRAIRQVQDKAAIASIVLDPNNARKQGQDLMDEGHDVVEFVQNKANYNEPCRYLEQLLKNRQLRHGGHRVLRWMAANAASEEDGLGNIMPKKKKSAEKIDGIVALVMALGVLMKSESEGYWSPEDGVFA